MTKKIETLQKQIADLQARRPEIALDLKALDALIKAKNDEMGDAVIAGRKTDKLKTEAMGLNVEKSGFEAAISKADADLLKLRSELDQAKKDELAKQLTAELAEIRAELHQAAKVLIEMGKNAEAWRKSLVNIAGRADAAGLFRIKGNADHTQHLFPFSIISNTSSWLSNRIAFREDRKNRVGLLKD